MPTDGSDPTIAKAPVQLNLTAAGWAIVVMIGAAIFMSARNQLAVGFLFPLVAAVAIDLFLSWHLVSDRQVSIVPSRTVVYRPDGIPLRVQVSGRPSPVLVKVVFRGAPEAVASITDETVILELDATHSGVVNYLRCNLSCSVFGLALAHRWQTHRVPMLHWAPAPSPVQLTTPDAIDEVARLREYVPGDRMSRVSWPITARTGRMHVRAAGDGHEEFIVVLNLGPVVGEPGEGAVASKELAHQLAQNPRQLLSPSSDIQGMPGATSHDQRIALIDGTLQLAATLISQLLEEGHQVRLITNELHPGVIEALRQSALDSPRLLEVLPSDTRRELHIADRNVLDDDELARRLALAEIGPAASWGHGSYVDISMLGIRTLP